VIGKILEVIFRHKLLLMVAPILIPLVAGGIAFAMARPYYETWIGVWVERPAYLTYTDDWNKYVTPAQNQAGRINELLRAQSFVREVVKSTPLASLGASPSGEDQLQQFVQQNIAVIPNNNMLNLRVRAPTAELSYQLAAGLLEAFRQRSSADRLAQGSLATSFLEGQARVAQESLDKANAAIRRYIAANPRYSTIDPDRGAAATAAGRLGLPAVAIDPQLGELIRAVEQSEREVERSRNALAQVQFDVSASLEGQDLGLQVVDPPRMPTRAILERRKLLIYPVAGLLAGLGVSVALVVALAAADRSARSEADLAPSFHVLGAVPDLATRQISKKVGAHAARRAIGFASGRALPAPRG
jgi:capsular polysaccharide biosynthesis protein